VHVILIDNGRTRLLADATLREALYCLRCGACLNACPVYRRVGGHAYGYAYSGPIGAVLAPGMLGVDAAPDLPFASTLCGACRDVCPVRIDLPELLLTMRQRVVAEARRGPSSPERWAVHAWRGIALHPWRYRLAARAARAGAALLGRLPALARLVPALASWTRARDLPQPAAVPFHQRWRARGDEASRGT
jgi:L-lactate dehydrogenase complex protein LldF